MINTKSISTVILVLCSLLLLTACQDSEKISIGIIQPLTGGGAELGQSVAQGIEIANQELGNKYNLIFEDDQCIDTAGALSGARKLVSVDGVDFIIGPLCTGPFLSVSDFLNQEGIPFVSTGSATPVSVEAQGKYGVAGIATDIDEVNVKLATFIYNELGIQKMAIFVWEQQWGIDHRDAFTREFVRLGGEVVFDETFVVEETDFRVAAEKIKRTEAEGILIVALNFQNGNIVKQFRQLGISQPMFGQFEVENTAFIDATGDFAERYIYTHPDTNPEFIQKYQKKYDSIPQYYSFVGYDSLMLFDKAIAECGDSRNCVIEYIKNGRFQGAGGTITFQNGSLTKSYRIKTIQDGEFVLYEK